jgi:hypothetical protein
VEVDLVDPAALEELRAGRGREDPFRPVGAVDADSDRGPRIVMGPQRIVMGS